MTDRTPLAHRSEKRRRIIEVGHLVVHGSDRLRDMRIAPCPRGEAVSLGVESTSKGLPSRSTFREASETTGACSRP